MSFDPGFLPPAALAFLIAAGSPGPATLAVAATAMAKGRRSGRALACGLALGLSLWGCVAAAGLGALMLAWAPAMLALRLIGGAYLLYLAWASARSALSRRVDRNIGADTATAGKNFRRGLMLNAMNPKAVLAWTAVIAVALPANATPAEIWAIVALCSGIGLLIYIAYADAFSRPAIMAGYARARRWLEAGFAALFGAAGLKLMLSRGPA